MSTPRPSLLLLAALVIVAVVYAPVLSGPYLMGKFKSTVKPAA